MSEGGPSAPTPPNGNTSLAAWCRKFTTYAQSLQVKSFVGGKISRTTSGTFLEAGTSFGGGTAPAASLTRVWFDSMREDYLVCVNAPFTATTPTSADYILVAKPEELRNSVTSTLIDGLTYNYTYPFNPVLGGVATSADAFRRRTATVASGPSITIKEVIVPRYIKYTSGPTTFRTPLYAMTVSNGTGVTSIGANDGTTFPSGTAITMIDVNIGARAWSKKRDQST